MSACSIFAASCQNKNKTVAPATYPIEHTQYYVRFIEAKKEVQADVTFKVDKNLGVEAYPHQYFFNEIIMAPKNLPEMGLMFRYIHEPTVYKPPFIFQYALPDGNIVKDSMTMPKLVNLRVGEEGLSLSKGGKLLWDEKISLQESDLLRVILIDSKGKDFTINHAGITAAGELELPLDKMSEIALGKASLIVSMSRSIPGEKVSKKIEFYYKDIETTIKA